MEKLSSVNRFLLDLLFPSRCFNCGKYGEIVCSECLSIIKIFRNFNQDSKLIYVSAYKNALIRKMVLGLKYYGITELAGIIASLMRKALTENSIAFTGDWFIVPVPMHPRKQRKRSYNQAALIAQELAKKLNLEYFEILVKVKNTRSQTKFNRSKRLAHISGAFKCIAPLNNSKILIIDDICTTGSTLHECALTLQSAGAGEIKYFAFANNY